MGGEGPLRSWGVGCTVDMPPWMESGFHFGRDSKATIRVRAMAYLTRMNCMAYFARMIWAIRRRFQIDHAAILIPMPAKIIVSGSGTITSSTT